MSRQNTGYHWTDCAPPAYGTDSMPVFKLVIPTFRHECNDVIEHLNEEGKKFCKRGEYHEAMWKYYYSKNICYEWNISDKRLTRACANSAFAALKLLEKSPHRTRLFNIVANNCGQIIMQKDVTPPEPRLLQKAYYRRAECFRIHIGSGKSGLPARQLSFGKLGVLEDYTECYQLESKDKGSDMSSLVKAIMVTVDWGKQPEHLEKLSELLKPVFNSYSKTLNLIKLMMKSEDMKLEHLELLLTRCIAQELPSGAENHLELTKQEGISLLRDLITKKSTPSDTKQAVSVIAKLFKCFKDDDIPVELYKSCEVPHVRETLYQYFAQNCRRSHRLRLVAVSKCLVPAHRTQLLLQQIEENRYSDALTVLQGGDIEPEKIHLSEIILDLLELDDTHLLELLLEREVDPKDSTSRSRTTSVRQLVVECKRSKANKRKMIIIVDLIVLLLNSGCDTEDLCEFNDGRKTTPLHVATELSLITGKTDLLRTVVARIPNATTDPPPLDQDNRTPIHTLAEKRFSSFDVQLVTDVCELLVKDAKVSLECKDVYDKTVFDQLSPSDRLCIEIRKFQDQMSEAEMPVDTQQVQVDDTSAPVDLKQELAHSESQPDEKSGDKGSNSESENQNEEVDTTELLEQKLVTLLRKDASYFSPTEGDILYTETPVHHKTTNSELNTTRSATDKSQTHSDKMPVDSESKQEEHPRSRQGHRDTKERVPELDLDGQVWEVVCSDKVKKFLKNSRYQLNLRNKAALKIWDIASGNWNADNKKSVSRTREIYEARISRSVRIIWGITVQFSARMTEELKTKLQKNGKATDRNISVKSEMLMILAIVLDHDDIHHHVKVAEKSFDTGSRNSYDAVSDKAFVSQNTKRKQRLPNLYIPTEFMGKEGVLEAAKEMGCESWQPEIVEVDKNCAKFYSLTTSNVLSLLYNPNDPDDRRDYPLKVSDEEYGIIKIPDNQAILLLGRSGTGKTTCCLYRMWNLFKAYWQLGAPGILTDEPLKVQAIDGTNSRVEECASSHTTSYEEDISYTSGDYKPSKEEVPCVSTDDSQPLTETSCASQSFTEDGACISSEEVTSSGSPAQAHLHQVFIAKNFIFCEQMQERFYDFVAGEDAIKWKTEHLSYEDKDLPASLSDINDLAYPLFLPARKFFLKLDQSLGDGKDFFKNVDSFDYYHDDNETLDALMEFEMSDSEDEDEQDSREPGRPQRAPQETQQKQRYTEVTASYFETEMWLSLKNYCQDSKTDPLLVWTEIQSFIKGSFEAITSEDGFLSEQEYEAIGRKRAPHFTGSRSEVYEVFKEYKNILKHKDASKRMYDECDFILNLFKRLNSLPPDKCLPWAIHRLYVDEVQDFTQAQLAVLLRCCKDPKGFFFTGDTAQSIVRGISFRFEEIKSIFQDMASKLGNVEVPKLHSLTINHRSHSGVTELASSVTDLLKEYFPHSFDHKNVPKDCSLFPGRKPVFLGSYDEKKLVLHLSDNKQKGSTIEFGAHQVVIVRNEEAKENVPDFIRDSAIVLSIQESKGLEFDDVLVYNFFTDLDMHAAEVWRIVTTFVSKKHPGYVKHHPKLHPLTFEWSHHKFLGSELKLLYTVITRAKQNLWFYESGSQDSYLPMLNYWQVEELVETVDDKGPQSGDQIFAQANRSTDEDWKQQGDIYRRKYLFMQAIQCYKKANDHLKEWETTAVYHVYQAKKSRPQLQPEEYRKAALLFLKCDETEHDVSSLESAAKCLYYARNYKNAAELFKRLKKLEALFYVYKATKDDKKCAEVKAEMGDYKGAIQYLLSRHKSDAAVKLALRFADRKCCDPQKNPIQELTKVAHTLAQKFIREKQVKELSKVVTLLPSLQRVDFLKQAQLFPQACQELVKGERYEAAIHLYRARGMWKEAVALAESQGSTDLSRLIIQAATAEIVQHGQAHHETKSRLEKISEDEDLETKAHALVLLAKHFLVKDKVASIRYTERALSAYENLHGMLKVGEFEAFNLLVVLQKQQRCDLKFIEKIVKKCLSITSAVQTIESEGISSPAVRNVLHFYGIQKLVKEFCVFPNQDLWIKSLHTCKPPDTPEYHSDGMLELCIQLDSSEAISMICRHLKGYAKLDGWLKGSEQVACSKLDEFHFHSQIVAKKLITQSFRSLPYDHLDHYLSTCSVGLLLDKVGIQDFRISRKPRVVQLFSPFSLLYLPLNRQHFNSLEELAPEVYRCLKGRVNSTLKRAQSYSGDNPQHISATGWLEIWRLLGVLGTGHTQLENTIANMGKVAAKHAQESQQIHSGNKLTLPYQFIHFEGEPTHYFSLWLRSCKAICQDGKVLYAVRELALPFIKTVASKPSLRMYTQDLVNIFSILSTAIFSLLAAHSIREHKAVTFYLPQTFYHMVKTFDVINCQHQGEKTLIKACSLNITRQKSEHLFNCLWEMLRVLLGMYKDRFFVLKNSVEYSSKIESTEALHCLVLTLTILGNMALLYKKEDMLFYQKKIIEAFEPLTHYTKSNNGPELTSLQEAYISFAECTGTQDIFRNVILKLLSRKGFGLIELKAIRHPQLEVVFSDKECQIDHIPQRPLKVLTNEILSLENGVSKLRRNLSERAKLRKVSIPDVAASSQPQTTPVTGSQQQEVSADSTIQNQSSSMSTESIQADVVGDTTSPLYPETSSSPVSAQSKTEDVTDFASGRNETVGQVQGDDIHSKPTQREEAESGDVDRQELEDQDSQTDEDFDSEDEDTIATEIVYNRMPCPECGEPINSEEMYLAHIETNEHKENLTSKKAFDDEFKWQYGSCEAGLKEKVTAGKKSITTISDQMHDLIHEAEAMLRSNEDMIERIKMGCNWREGVATIVHMTDNAEKLIETISKQESVDASSDTHEHSQTDMYTQDDESVMSFSFQRQQSAEAFQRQQSSEKSKDESRRGGNRRKRGKRKQGGPPKQ